MINIIWQTRNTNKPVLNDETLGQYEYITKVVLKNVDHKHFFDDKQYKTFLNNSIIVYSAPLSDVDVGLKKYLAKYKELDLKYMLFHLSNESLGHNYYYYSEAAHVFRVHYDVRIKNINVTTLPLGFTTGYMNNEGHVNLSDKRDISTVFIGQTKSDRQTLIDSISDIENSFIHLTKAWGCSTSLSFDKVIDIYKRTRFVPCPMGNISPETLRLFEALEWGCVPVTKIYRGLDYYKYIFGDHPLPLINEWSEMKYLIEKLNSGELDNLILSINVWYRNMMNSVSEKVSGIINKKFY